MTRITANIILLIMAGVWAYMSVTGDLIQPVSDNFIKLGALVATGEGWAAADISGAIMRKLAPKDKP